METSTDPDTVTTASVRAERLNVIVLTLDTVRADRLSLYGYPRPTSPALERMAEDAIVCEHAFTHGPFTSNACVQIFTSSRPLSYGGYNRGAIGRPPTLFKAFQDAGYRTTGISTVHWVSRFFGYTGLDEELALFTLNTMVGMTSANMMDTLRLYHEGRISSEVMLRATVPVIDWLFRHADEYCAMQVERLESFKADFPDTILVNSGYDYQKVQRVTRRHRAEFEADHLAYIHRHLSYVPASHQWIAKDWNYCRTYAKFAREAVFRVVHTPIAAVNPALARRLKARTKHYPDAHALADKVISTVRERDPSRPFFVWAHFKDTHMPYVGGHGADWVRGTTKRLAALGHPTDIDPAITFRPNPPRTKDELRAFSALYDAAVHSTDEAIGRIVDAVEGMGLGTNTLIAVCADHGEEFGEHGNHEHSGLVYEHNVSVPMIFWLKGLETKRIDSLVSLLDFAPTIAEMAGIDRPPDWEGNPLTSDSHAARSHILMETFCRGNVLFEHRPLYMGVRSRSHKYLWKEYRDHRDRFSRDGHELYDLDADPEESINIFKPDHPVVLQFNPIIAERLAEIPEMPAERIVAAFGKVGEDALRRYRRAGS